MWTKELRAAPLRTFLAIFVVAVFVFISVHRETVVPKYSQLSDYRFSLSPNINRQRAHEFLPLPKSETSKAGCLKREVLCRECIAPKQLQPFAQNYIAVRYHNKTIDTSNCSQIISEVVILDENINAVCNALRLNFGQSDQKTLEKLEVNFAQVEDWDELKFMAFIHVLNHVAWKSYSLEFIHDYGKNVFSKKVNMWYWNTNNWGDLLGPVIVEKLSNVSTKNNKDVYDAKAGPEFYSVGSLLQWMYDSESCFSWGSGERMTPKFKETKNAYFQGQRIFSVRGCESQVSVLANTGTLPHVAMDPALLAVKLFYPANLTGEYEFCVVPHMGDYTFLNKNYPRGNPGSNNSAIHIIHVNRVGNPFRERMQNLPIEIAKCERILSSSLHGMILGHAFGIPTAGIQLGNKSELRTKYRDHYESLGIYLSFDRIKPVVDVQQLVNSTHLKFLVDSTPQPSRPIDLQPTVDTYPFPIIDKWRNLLQTDHWLF